VAVLVSEPIVIPPECSDSEMEQKREEIEAILNGMVERAETVIGSQLAESRQRC
jgi:hypothetical protein